MVFAATNAALIVLERRDGDAPFYVPVFLPWVGVVLSLVPVVANFVVDGGSTRGGALTSHRAG